MRLNLQAKILLCALANILLLTGALLWFARGQFRNGLDSILLAPAQGRLQLLGDQIMERMEAVPNAEWPAILAEAEKTHGVTMGLFRNQGGWIVGSIQELPEAMHRELQGPQRGPDGPEGPPPPGRGFRPPPEAEREMLRSPEGPGRRRQHPVFFAEVPGPQPAYWFGVRIGLRPEGAGRPVPATLFLRTESVFLTPLFFDPRPWVIGMVVAILITLICWLPFIRRLTGAIRRITWGAERMAEGRFDVRIAAKSQDEVGHLSDALNRMAAQLNGFVHGQKRFLGDIAHELSAPLARTQVAVAILEERAPASQQRYVATVREEIQHISTLVNELLHFSRAGLIAQQKPSAPVPLGRVVQEVVEREASGEEGLDVRLDEGGLNVEVLADRDSLARAVSNVLRNAIRYAGQDGPITISAARGGSGEVAISVADSGPGLPEEALDRVFTPFYRVDSSRSRDSGGVGLGLAIVKAAVEGSGGSVSCHNRVPRGLEVVIRLPGVDASAS